MANRLKPAVRWLIAGVLLVDLVFVVTYFLAGLRSASDTAKVAFTAVWTLATLAVVLRGLSRIRHLRLQNRE